MHEGRMGTSKGGGDDSGSPIHCKVQREGWFLQRLSFTLTNRDCFFFLFSFLITLCGSEPGLKQADASSVTAAFPPRGSPGPAGLRMLLC